jgi:hypothetical protein
MGLCVKRTMHSLEVEALQQALELKPPHPIAARTVEPGEYASHFDAMNTTPARRLHQQQGRYRQLCLKPWMPMERRKATRRGLVHAFSIHVDAVYQTVGASKIRRRIVRRPSRRA